MSSTENTSAEKRDVYARVTAQIITAIEQGTATWRMPWHTSGRFAFSPINIASRKPYRLSVLVDCQRSGGCIIFGP
jgi:antirestriction protein ArdC